MSGLPLGKPELETKCSQFYDKKDIYSIQVDSRCFIHTNIRDLLTAKSPNCTTSRKKDEDVCIVIGMGCKEYQLINSILEGKELVKVDLVFLPNMDIKLTIQGIPFSIWVLNKKWPLTMNTALTLIMLLLFQMEIGVSLVINTDVKDLKRVLTKAHCHRYELPKLEEVITARMPELNLWLDLNPVIGGVGNKGHPVEKPEKGTGVENYKLQHFVRTNDSTSILQSKTYYQEYMFQSCVTKNL
ncbi:3022_t:CDS:2 [Gigaspora margarita]|uniref:3022_t:CDS:1 n=1 Tax=Gigaspora margarita TaxID=4874 RepID=A0ABN7UKE2_GIGMA|nr:3022_t:CDS:2 [Gigaspora margarita]